MKLVFHEMLRKKISQCILPFRNFTKFTGKYLYRGLLFNKVAGLRLQQLYENFFWGGSSSIIKGRLGMA